MLVQELFESVAFKNIKSKLEVKRADDRYIDLDLVHTGDVVIDGKAVHTNHQFATSNIRASFDGKIWKINNLHVAKELRGEGISEDLMKEVIKITKCPVSTSGVHSPDGKRKLDAMVRRGQATKDGDMYIINF